MKQEIIISESFPALIGSSFAQMLDIDIIQNLKNIRNDGDRLYGQKHVDELRCLRPEINKRDNIHY